MKTVNFGGNVYEGSINWSHNHITYFIAMTETIQWRITPFLMRSFELGFSCLAIEVGCLYKHDSPEKWHMNTEIEMIIISKNRKVARKIVHRFHKNSRHSIIGNLMPLADFHRQYRYKNQFEILIITKIRIVEDVGVYLSEFSIPRNIDSEIAVRLDSHILYVDKYALMCFSTVFRRKLAEMAKNNADVLTIFPQVFEYTDFVEFLRILYRQKQELTADNIDAISLLSSMYDIGFLMKDCEDFLIATKRVSIVNKLSFAEFNTFPGLQANILETISIDQIINIVVNDVTSDIYLLKWSQQALLKKIIMLDEEGEVEKNNSKALL